MECPNGETLRDFAFGFLQAELSDQIAEHVTDCADCANDLKQFGTRAKEAAEDLLDSFCDEDEQSAFEARAIRAALDGLQMAGHIKNLHIPTDEMPERFGKFKVLKRIGKGGMGQVFLAEHDLLGEQVALKVLANHRWQSETARKLFLEEMKAIGKLNHDNIVRPVHADEHDGVLYLAMEYLRGETVSAWLKQNGKMPLRRACLVVSQVAMSLQEIHSHAMVHRDIKPSNVMLEEHGRVKVLDLGLAMIDPRAAHSQSHANIAGTKSYLAPEIVNDHQPASPRSDIYSLGVMFFRLLLGKLPSECNSIENSLDEQAPALPEGIKQLLRKMLSADPTDRPNSAIEITQTLQGAIEKKRSPVWAILLGTSVAILCWCAMSRWQGTTNVISPLNARSQAVIKQDDFLVWAIEKTARVTITRPDNSQRVVFSQDQIPTTEFRPIGFNLQNAPFSDRDVAELAKQSSLQSVTLLAANGVTADGIAKLGSLTDLTELDCSWTNVDGYAFEWLRGRTPLRRLSVSINGKSIGMNWLNGLSNLSELEIHGNPSKPAYTAIASLPKLESLTLFESEIASGFSELSRSQSLRSLHLQAESMPNSAAISLSQIPRLQTLSVRIRDVTGDWISQLAKQKTLERLTLDIVAVNENDLRSLANSNLKTLHLANTPVSAETIRLLRKNVSLVEISE